MSKTVKLNVKQDDLEKEGSQKMRISGLTVLPDEHSVGCWHSHESSLTFKDDAFFLTAYHPLLPVLKLKVIRIK